jgi:hypothetical protein
LKPAGPLRCETDDHLLAQQDCQPGISCPSFEGKRQPGLEQAMNVISTLIGIVALIAALVAFIPLLGWLNWLVIPVVAIGLVLGLLSDKTTGRNINLAVLVIAMFRLFIGGGVI